MAKTVLEGTIISNYKVDTSLVFIDMSIYNDIISITEATLMITMPYSKQPIPIYYNVKSNTVITSISLNQGIAIEQIPCGLYKFKQSICPNDKLFYEFWYVHVGGFKQKLAKLYCENKIDEATKMDIKLNTLEALSYCINEDSEKRILAILDSLDCEKEVCYTNKKPMNKILTFNTNKCSHNLTKNNCKTCNSL